ncbi:MAG: hypothetical protein E6R03_17105 [Hyphomicrobiaceae bacterium]|nr:MAG: hypothetical protein E6R03_17105 [Hyphomicrobiaceae bacterium]
MTREEVSRLVSGRDTVEILRRGKWFPATFLRVAFPPDGPPTRAVVYLHGAGDIRVKLDKMRMPKV